MQYHCLDLALKEGSDCRGSDKSERLGEVDVGGKSVICKAMGKLEGPDSPNPKEEMIAGDGDAVSGEKSVMTSLGTEVRISV